MAFTAKQLLQTKFDRFLASELVDSGHCHGTCLLGNRYENCNCACGGEFHGALRGAEVRTRDSISVGETIDWDGTDALVLEKLTVMNDVASLRIQYVGENGALQVSVLPERAVLLKGI